MTSAAAKGRRPEVLSPGILVAACILACAAVAFDVYSTALRQPEVVAVSDDEVRGWHCGCVRCVDPRLSEASAEQTPARWSCAGCECTVRADGAW